MYAGAASLDGEARSDRLDISTDVNVNTCVLRRYRTMAHRELRLRSHMDTRMLASANALIKVTVPCCSADLDVG